jgi:uncharacterized protein YcbX
MSAMPVGRVVQLWRYPVKSMAGEPLEAADVYWHGLAGDRRYAFVRPGLERSGFPWLTIRERPDLVGYRPRFRDPARPDASRVVVRTPAGEEVEVTALSLGEGVRAMKLNRGAFDAAPLSLISASSIGELDVRRFRPNLLVEAAGEFPEDAWVGRLLRIGGLLMRVDRRDSRCVIVDTDPDTGERDPAVLKELGRARQGCLGVYGSTVQPGRVAVGDSVFLED